MFGSRAPWWMYVVAAVFALTFCFNVWQEASAPAGAGFKMASQNPYATTLTVGAVVPAGPFDKAGVRAGDILEAVNGYPVRTVPDWYVLRGTLDMGRPVKLDIRRGDEHLHLQFVMTAPAWQTWDLKRQLPDLAFHLAQLILLLLAILVAFSRPEQLSARLAALMFAMAAVFNGAPPYGWFAALHHLPALFLVPISLADVSWNLSSVVWLAFFAVFPRRTFTRSWQWAFVLAPTLILLPRVGWYLAAIHAPERVSGIPMPLLTWPVIVAIAQEIGGIGLLLVNYRRAEDVNERRRLRVLLFATCIGLPAALAFVIGPPLLAFVGALVFLTYPLAFVYAVLRHRLFDIRIIIRQGLQYAVARGVLVSAVPALAGIFVLDLVLHGEQPAVAILEARGWVYVGLGALALVTQARQKEWLAALDRRFFRERYDGQRLLHEVVEEVRQAGSFERMAPRVVARVEAALHPEFVALLVRDPREASYHSLAAAPAGQAPPPLRAESKLLALVRVLGKPLEVSLTESGWLKQQLPQEETDFLRQARIDLLVPVAVDTEHREALLALGVKRSEEPYTREDKDLLVAIATSLALLLEKPVAPGFSPAGALIDRCATAAVSEALAECPQCGACYDTGAGRCAQEGASLTPVRLPRLLAGRYRLERRRGRGGMGAVYEALDTALERRVAVKVLRDDLVGSAEAAERFRREARVAASFTHPNVVTVYDFGVAADTRAFLVMELLQGSSLREELQKNQRLPAPRSVEILRGVFAAVEAAHRRQLIHRDLKPENIFLARGETGEVSKVLDFGIAKFLPAATQATADTGSAVLVGTLRYMAPEQLRGQAVSTAWDLWALAVVAYEMLTGAPPFAGATAAECHGAVLMGRFTPVTTLLPEAAPRWQDFFVRAFSLNLSDRPKSAQPFFTDLERALK